MKRIKYEIVDHGIDNPNYFSGCGTAYTGYDHVVTGIGDTYSEALHDALDMLAFSEEEIDSRQLEAIYNMENIEGGPSASEEIYIDISNNVTPFRYIERDCDHKKGEYCEECHNATVNDWIDDLEDYASYYVSIRYRLEKR